MAILCHAVACHDHALSVVRFCTVALSVIIMWHTQAFSRHFGIAVNVTTSAVHVALGDFDDDGQVIIGASVLAFSTALSAAPSCCVWMYSTPVTASLAIHVISSCTGIVKGP